MLNQQKVLLYLKGFSLAILMLAQVSFSIPFDKIIAIVDKEIILHSDLEEMMELYKNQPMFIEMDDNKKMGFILEKLIDEKIILTIAERDTTIELSKAEIDHSAKNYLQQLYDQNGGEFNFEDILYKSKGISLAEFKKTINEQMREQRLKQKLQEKYLGKMEPTALQVKKFYNEYKDSLPKLRDNYKISHLEYSIFPDKKLLKKAYDKCDSLIKLLDKGESFELLAKRHSDDPSGRDGGDLGFMKKGTLDNDYEKSAFTLKEGDYTSRPVHTALGYHVIKVTGKKDTEIKTSHILIRVLPTFNDTLKTYQYLDSLARVSKEKNNFSKLAGKLSEDKETRMSGGSMGWFTNISLESTYKDIVDTLVIGGVSEPMFIDGKYHLFRLDDKSDERGLTLEDDWNQISMLAKNKLLTEKLQGFLEKWKKEVNVQNLSSHYVSGDALIFKSE